MSYPTNIAPGLATPTPYDVVPINDAILYVSVRAQPYITVQGAKSRARVDLPLYDQSVTRDYVDASTLGRGGVSIVEQTGVASSLPFNGDLLLSDQPVTIEPDEVLTMMQQDDRFTHIAPHQNVLGKTVIRWYDGEAASGNVVGECDDSRYIGCGTQIPQYPGSVPPIFTP